MIILCPTESYLTLGILGQELIKAKPKT